MFVILSQNLIIEYVIGMKKEFELKSNELKSNNKIEQLIETYESLFRKAPVPYFLLDKNMMIKQANESSKKLLDSEGLEGTSFFSYVQLKDQNTLFQFIKNMKNDEEYSIDVDLYINEDMLNVKIYANLVKSESKAYYRFTVIDQTALYKQMEEVKYLSFHDQLTGVYNRHFLMVEMERVDKARNYPIALIMADVNNLKLVNDAFGHEIGDQIISQTGRVLIDSIRGDDILARTGGDEFVVVLPKTTEAEVEKLISRMKKSSKVVGVKDLELSVSFGYAVKEKESQLLVDVLKLAEDDMYKNKVLNRTEQRKNVIESIINTLYLKHPREKEHSRKVSEYAVMVAKEFGYTNKDIINIKTASLLHDIGKIAIDYSILDQRNKLSSSDFEETMKHSSIGYRILSSSGVFADVADMVLSHHEHVDGTGYPRGLKSFELSKSAKILSVCDAYAAMTSDRAYRSSMSKEAAINELIKMKGKQFDPHTVDVMVRCLNKST